MIPTLAQRIGQLLLIGFRGLTIDQNSVIAKDLQERNLGGVVLFDKDLTSGGGERNIRDPLQVKALTASVRKLATTVPFVSVDQEGGLVARLKPKYGFPPTLSAAKLALLSPADFDRESDALATTLADHGFNVNFAPSVDVNVNPENPIIGKVERSFSADPAVVSKLALQLIEAHHRHAVLTVIKHFPGHGSSRADSHLGMVDVTNTWQRYEIDPFVDIIKAGRADAVMTAHVFHRGLDEDHPATLSKAILGGLLRKHVGWDGVVFTDDMQMGAITQHYGLDHAIELALGAGADVLVFGNNVAFDEHITERVIHIILGLVKDGKVSEARLDASYERVRKLKQRL